MKDLKIKLKNIEVTFEFGTSMTVMDFHGNRWDGEGNVAFTWISLTTPDGSTLLRVIDNYFTFEKSILTENNIDQLSNDITFEEVSKIMSDNFQYFVECYSYILNNPDQNGEC